MRPQAPKVFEKVALETGVSWVWIWSWPRLTGPWPVYHFRTGIRGHAYDRRSGFPVTARKGQAAQLG